MIGLELKILFRQEMALLLKDKKLTFAQLNLPEIAKTFKEPAYWIIKVLNYNEDKKKLFCEIISYHVGKTEFGYNQILLADTLNEIQTITFRSVDTNGLLKTLEGTSGSFTPNKNNQLNRPIIKEFKFENKQKKIIINETFYVPLKNVRFKFGGISFDKKFNEYNSTIEITIVNFDIREEFDAVKNYFANILKTKRISVTVYIEIENNELTLIEAKSPEIEKINNQLIDSVRFEFVRITTKKKINLEINKSLFTMDEYFETFADEKFKSNTFHTNEKQLFEDILKISNTKHYKHLRYLSSKHSHEIMKLRFVHKPFSFIFLIQGDKKYHIIWETLDTKEATYIWHIPKDLNLLKITLKKVEDIINSIKIQGKNSYINFTEDQFTRVYHDYSELVDGFVKWKGELESRLT